MKRTADNYVKYGGDIGSFEDFADLVKKNVKNVAVVVVEKEDIVREKFPMTIPTFKGTTKVHQALWSDELPYSISFRDLSCFSCLNSFLPCEHRKHLGVLSTGFRQETNAMSFLDLRQPDFNKENDLPMQLDSVDDRNSDVDIGSDTIFNNIEDDYMFLSEIDGTFSWTEIPFSATSLPAQEQEKPKILSNVKIDYHTNRVDAPHPQYGFEDWVVVKYVTEQSKYRSLYYVGKIIDIYHSTNEYKVAFLKRKSTKFIWPTNSDDDIVPGSRIIQVLKKPNEGRRGQFSFDCLPNLKFN